MPTSMLMSLGTRAMFAAYAQLQTTSHNIANANVEGYSRQRVLLTTTPGQYTGAGFFGRGVSVATVERASNMFLTQQATATASAAAADRARHDMLRQLEAVFGSGEAGLGMAATKLFNAFSDLASAAADLPARQAVLARAADLVSLVRAASDQIEALQANTVHDMANAISEVNTLAAGVAQLNLQIASAQGQGHAPNDLMDRRAELVSRIADKLEVNTVHADDGTLSLFIGNGQNLVLRGQSNRLLAAADEFDPARTQIQVDVAGQTSIMPSAVLGGGLIRGLLEFQDSDLRSGRNQLGQLAGSLALQINQQQALGLDLNRASGAPLFRTGTPLAMPAASNARDLVGNFIATPSIGVADSRALKDSEYELRPDPLNAAQYLLTRLSDGVLTSGLVDGSTVDGFTLNIGAGAPLAGDRFLLKPVSMLAQALALALDQPRGLAAANPLTAVAAATNTGSASVQSLAIDSAPTSAYQATSLRFTNASGAWDLLDASNAVLASGSWSAGSPITYNGFALQLNGVPANGDTLSIAPTVFASANNGNALALNGLAESLIVDGRSLGDAYAGTLANVGVRVQGARAALDTSSTVAGRAKQVLSGETGVNLDEEASRLIEYQQSYQAAARMLQTAQTVMDTLLELGR